MSWLKTIWGRLFRLFPCPTPTGLRRVGTPGRDSPVLVTCNFDLTVKILTRELGRAGVDAWLLVADSKGVNVWCAAGGDELNTRSVVAAVKTSGVADQVDHRRLVLPPLGGPGICAEEVQEQTGWTTRWGPVRAREIPRYLADGNRKSEPMMRVTCDWRERIDTALGSLFFFFLLGALGFAIFGRNLLLDYLLVGTATFLLFMLACPWIPGRRGLTKVLLLEVVLGAVLVAAELLSGPAGSPLRADLIIAMVVLFVTGSELGGLSPDMSSELDPFLARLGIGAIGNVAFAGTVRTELLNGDRELIHEPERCIGCRACVEICPQGVWEMGREKKAALARGRACTACRACLVQCTAGAIRAPLVEGASPARAGGE